ncbi:MAG: Peptidoglycan/LPS O-acetylase OafA/YrhL, contains acyltransferase and SGNH-hydrolase domain [Cypionkella sp.]|uniref:acyltransferase family protein n=1 Tax=Cypionkella sp. TaxID=2811411 RepID=UPI0026047509|nr:acyltransferase [Cypionkella sp.]MDB5661574.1 Peptidoglycan/LPS O-acetylase OafA/YrhL, contains acyltransferase and SGNH-hydrolase domain [Cypionkella sp.]
MVWLGTGAQGRDNNFNLIRMIAATLVLVSHAWPLTKGAGVMEPLQAFTGHSLGTLAVYIFFAISGFLITASYTRTARLPRFLLARGLRLFPGLAVSLLLVAFVLAPLVTLLPLSDYLMQPQTWTFFPRGITLISPQYTLPGVFITNPYPTVEGPIWTLIHEVACYGLVVLVGMVGMLRRNWPVLGFLGVYGASWIATTFFNLPIHPRLIQLQGLSLPFVMGMVAWVWRHNILLSGWIVLGLALAALVGKHSLIAYPLLISFLTYASLWLAYVPNGKIRNYNRFGDYSYGMYIYAMPLQGLVIWIFGPTDPLPHIIMAFPITLGASILSWNFIESPALALRK